jgi:TRAP-type C4-dicarboxylate transport system permease small subunit
MTRLYDFLLAGINTIASLWVLFLVGLISTDVIGRAFFNSPLPGVPEIVKFSIIGMVWMWMAYALRTGAQLRTNLVLGRLPPLGRRLVLVANSAIGVCLFAMIAWLGWVEMMKSYEFGAFEGEDPVRILVWPLWAILVVGAALTSLQYAFDTIRFLLRDARSLEAAPAADTE